MSSSKTPPRRIYAIAANLFLVPAILIAGKWMSVYNNTSNPEMRVTEFLSRFPAAMQSHLVISLVMLACCVVSIVLGSISFNQRELYLRLTCIATVLIASLLALLTVFQML